MKKTLLLLALAASVGFASTASADTTDKTVVFSNTEAAASASLNGGGYRGIGFTLSNDPSRLVATSPDLTEIPSFSTFDLQSISILVRSNNTWNATGAFLIDETTNTVLAHAVNTIDSASGGSTVTFNFADLTLQADTAYKLLFVDAANIGSDAIAVGATLANLDATSARQLAALGGQTTATASECGLTNSLNGFNDTAYAPVVTITAIIPEPATATLSLLALAGLAARRRRH